MSVVIYFRLKLKIVNASINCARYSYKMLLVSRAYPHTVQKILTNPNEKSPAGNNTYPFAPDGWSKYLKYTLSEEEYKNNKIWFEIYEGNKKIHDQIGVKVSLKDDINFKWSVFEKKLGEDKSKPTKANGINDKKLNISRAYNYVRPFTFLIVDTIGKDGFLVRKVFDLNIRESRIDYDRITKALNMSYSQTLSERFPEKYGLSARNPKDYRILPAEHALAEPIAKHSNTPYISTSNRFPDGAGNFAGKKVFIDISQLEKAGVKQISEAELIKQLLEYKKQYPHTANRVDRLVNAIKNVEGEVLLHGEKIPAKAVFTPESLAKSQRGIKVGRGVMIVGIAFTAYDMGKATNESVKIKSAKPVAAETVRQIGGWGGAVLGAKGGAAAGALLGVETGPGLIVTGAIGGIIGGTAGYFGADWIADYIYED